MSLFLVKVLHKRLEHTLSTEKMYLINFTELDKTFCLSLHYNGSKIHILKAKGSEIVVTPLCLGNISKDWSVDNMEETGVNGYVYDSSVDCDAIAFDDILDIHYYLMKKNDIVQ